MHSHKTIALLVCAAMAALATACSSPSQAAPSGVTFVDKFTLHGPKNFLTGYDTKNADGTYNVVVEIPTGTSDKWEICTPALLPGCTAAGREMIHPMQDGKPIVVNHIGYPGNYGSLPKTLAEDRDPLDIIAIGPAYERGTIIPVKVVGVIRCDDRGDQDDKVVGITAGSPLYSQVSTMASLEATAPNTGAMLLMWYRSYKGGMTCSPLADETVAADLIAKAQAAFVAP